MKRITVLLASPRANGNSDKLAMSFIKGSEQAGNVVNVFPIRDHKINGCIGCEYCYDHAGECSQKDDMQKLYHIFENTDVLVISTPVYYQGFPSQLKAVVDRLYVTENRKFPISESVLLTTYATAGIEMSKMIIDYYCAWSNYLEFNNRGVIAIDNLDDKNDIDGNEKLRLAYEMGRDI